MTLGMAPLSILLAVGFMASAVAAQSNTVDRSKPKFLFPATPDETYHTKDILMVQYISFFDSAELWTFCQQGVGKYITQQRVPGFNATVPVQLNFTSADPCWFNIRTGGSDDAAFGENSPAFNVIGQRRASGPETFQLDDTPSRFTTSPSPSSESRLATSSLSAVPTTTISSAVQTTTISSASNTSGTQSSQAAETKSTDSPPSVPAKPEKVHPAVWAAIGLGIAVVVIASVAAGIFFWMRRRRKRAQNVASDQAYEAGPGSKPQRLYHGELDSSITPVEMANTQYPVKLSAGQMAYAVELSTGQEITR
ncbi:hypothetical protein QBC43DRAFT_298080 [Cladorrhinum sp. PSN259]|nr:hypothetical protein QBC43DRAFT_298080 [Cladorrhinum sp. PSN259]